MIRLVAVAIVLAVATSAQAMDSMTMQARQARQLPKCSDNVPGQVRIWGCPRCGADGICMLRVPPLARHRDYRRCAEWSEGYCTEYY